MASPSLLPLLELQLTICSAKDLKNVNWRHGDLKPYAVVWVDPNYKISTKVDDHGDTCPSWNQTLLLPFVHAAAAAADDDDDDGSTLFIDIVHAYAAQDTKPLIGSARLSIKEIIHEVGLGHWAHRSLKLKRPSGRPQGTLELKVLIRDPKAYPAAPPPPASYSYPQPYPYYGSAPTTYPYYTQPAYGSAPAGYPYSTQPAVGYAQDDKSGTSKFGVGTGLAVGAVAGALGGLALAEGIDYVEDKLVDDVENKVLDDLGGGGGGGEYDDLDDDDGGFGGDDF